MNVEIIGTVAEVYEGEESRDQTITMTDQDNGGVLKFSVRNGAIEGLKVGMTIRAKMKLMGRMGKGFRYFLTFQDGEIRPVKISVVEA